MQRASRQDSVDHETVWNLEIRANETWKPKKGMSVYVEDGYRAFMAKVVEFSNRDMKRKRWDIQIVEVE
jgi:hypothetical protein